MPIRNSVAQSRLGNTQITTSVPHIAPAKAIAAKPTTTPNSWPSSAFTWWPGTFSVVTTSIRGPPASHERRDNRFLAARTRLLNSAGATARGHDRGKTARDHRARPAALRLRAAGRGLSIWRGVRPHAEHRHRDDAAWPDGARHGHAVQLVRLDRRRTVLRHFRLRHRAVGGGRRRGSVRAPPRAASAARRMYLRHRDLPRAGDRRTARRLAPAVAGIAELPARAEPVRPELLDAGHRIGLLPGDRHRPWSHRPDRSDRTARAADRWPERFLLAVRGAGGLGSDTADGLPPGAVAATAAWHLLRARRARLVDVAARHEARAPGAVRAAARCRAGRDRRADGRAGPFARHRRGAADPHPDLPCRAGGRAGRNAVATGAGALHRRAPRRDARTDDLPALPAPPGGRRGAPRRADAGGRAVRPRHRPDAGGGPHGVVVGRAALP